MERLNRYIYLICLLSFCSINLQAQYGERTGSNTFAYTGDDALVDDLNFHNVFYGGFTNSLASLNQDIIFPIIPTLYFEYKYLFLKKNDAFNVSGNIQPSVGLLSFFLFRFPASINLNFLNEATTEHKDGFGLSFGGGYEALITTFNLQEYSPYLQVGFQIDNFKFSYQYKTKQTIFVNHSISVGVMMGQ